jgi:hypothetical protein
MTVAVGTRGLELPAVPCVDDPGKHHNIEENQKEGDFGAHQEKFQRQRVFRSS